MERNGLSLTEEMSAAEAELLAAGDAVIWLADQRRVLGLLGLADTIRDESREIVDNIKKTGLKTVLLTGDHEQAARNVAGRLGFDEVKFALLPEGKVSEIQSLID